MVSNMSGEAVRGESLGACRHFDPAEHRADARRRADDGEHENGEAALVLKQILALDVGDGAMGDHPKGKDEIERNATSQPTRNASRREAR